MADNPYVNKVVYDGSTIIDLTSDTVGASNLVSGYTAHDRSGAPISGSFDPSRYVEKAGDTMTGDLSMHNDADIHLENGEIIFQNEELDYTLLQPSETAYGDQIALKDANGNRIGYVIASVDANDTHGIILSATREDLNTPVYHGVGLYCDSSGNPSVYINEPASWRNALELGSTTTVTSNILSSTLPQNVTLTSASYAQWGKVATLSVTLHKAAKTSANTEVVLGTIVNGKRPAVDSPAILHYTGAVNYAYITASDGKIRVKSASEIPNPTDYTIMATYVLA